MNRTDWGFAVLVCLAVAVGGAAAVQYQGTLSATRLSASLATDVSVTVTGVEVREDGFRVRVEASNPTRTRVEARSGFVSVRTNGSRVAAGSDDFPEAVPVPPGERRELALDVPLSAAAVDRVRTAVERGGTVRGRVVMAVTGETFLVRFESPLDADPTGDDDRVVTP